MLEHSLRNDSSDRLGITLKFNLVAPPRGDGNAEELQAVDVVAAASRSITSLGCTPAVVALLNSVVDTGTKATTETQTFNNTWGILLKRMKLFNEIVTDIAQVLVLNVSTCSWSERCTDSPVHVAGLVCHISCDSGESAARSPDYH